MQLIIDNQNSLKRDYKLAVKQERINYVIIQLQICKIL